MVARNKPKDPPTYADIEALPENVVGEILNGELVVSPRPRPFHGGAAIGIVSQIRPFRRGRGGDWLIQFEPELRLGVEPAFDTVVPGLAGWRSARMPRLPDTASITLVPDWVCEILSPRTALWDRNAKLPFYARAGVEWAWIVDPDQRSIEIYQRLPNAKWMLVEGHGGDEAAILPPFEEIPFALAELWDDQPDEQDP